MGALDDSYEEWLASHHHGDAAFPDDPTDIASDQPLWPPPLEPDDPPGPTRPRPPRPVTDIRLDLDTALAYQERYRDRPAGDRWVRMMRDDNEADIARLEAELAAANAVGSTEWVETAEVSAVIDDYQGTARAAYPRGIPDDGGGADLPPATGRPDTTSVAGVPFETRRPRSSPRLPDIDIGL
jgi:hypothetical protein